MALSNLEIVLELIKTLSVKERTAVITAIHKLNVPQYRLERDRDAEERCNKYCEIIQKVTGIWPITKRKDTLTVYCKRVLAKLLKDDGFTYYSIGKAMELDHSTVVFHCKQAEIAEEYPNMYHEYYDVKQAVLKELNTDAL